MRWQRVCEWAHDTICTTLEVIMVSVAIGCCLFGVVVICAIADALWTGYKMGWRL